MDIICYLSNGYPTIEDSYNIATAYAKGGCKIIEIDFPARDPYLENELITSRMHAALDKCDNYERYMEAIIKVKNNLPDVQLLLLAYESTLLEIGVEKFIRFCLDNDLKDIILVGLKDNKVKNEIIQNGLRVSCYVQYHLDEQEIELAKESNGFVYLQAKPDGNVNSKYPTLKDCVQFLRDQGIDRPIYCGVGVHTPADAKMVKEAGADAAFIGSTILKLYDDIPMLKKTISEFIEQC